MTPRIKAALFYAKNGFGIVPCWSPNPDGTCRCTDPHDRVNGNKLEPKSRGKHPLPGTGPAHAITDEAAITTVLSGPTEPNYGIVPPAGCVEWDIDGGDIKVYADLVAKYGPLDTMTTKTGEGSHVVFRWPSWAGPIPKGNHFEFVTRTSNGYIIGPESMHYLGIKYEAVRDGRGMPLLPVDLPPAWVNAVIAQSKGKEKVLPGDDEKRHPAIVKAGVAARKGGADEAGVMAAAMECNASFDHPKDEAEVRAIVIWVMETVEPDPEMGTDDSKRPSLRLQLRRQASDLSTVFVDPTGNAFAQIQINGHTETVEIESRRMNDWLTMLYVKISHGNVPTPDALSQTTDYLATKARLSGKVREVGIRIAPLEGEAGFAIDLGTDDWTAAVVRPGRWAIEPHPVAFTRSDSVAAMPSPTVGRGVIGIESLRPLLNVPTGTEGDKDWIKIVGFLLGALKPGGPFAGLMLTGQAGSAKSSAARFIRRVIDPTPRLAEVMSAPSKEDGFAAAVRGGHVLAIDNVSAMPDALSDWLAQLATGYSSTKRALYTNNDAYVTKAVRPFIINGIDNAERGDLLSRLLSITLQPIDAYATFDSLYKAFDTVWGDVLGGLLDVAAVALAVEPTLPETGWTARMADHVRWVTAAERTLGWPDRSYEALMAEAQAEAQAETLEALLWWPHLSSLLDSEGGSWEGSRTDLLSTLMRLAEDRFGNVPNKSSWPRSPKGLADAMSRAAGGLRTQGITVRKKTIRGDRRLVIERRPSAPPTGESAPNHAQGAHGCTSSLSSTPAARVSEEEKGEEEGRGTEEGNEVHPSAPSSTCLCGADKTIFGGCADPARHKAWAKTAFDTGYDGFVKGTH